MPSFPHPFRILDEPTTGLDPTSRNQLWDEVRALGAGGTTILLTTQYLDEADRLADRVGILHRGSVIAEGTPEELKRRTGGELVILTFDAEHTASAATDLLDSIGPDTGRRSAAGTVEVNTDGSAEHVRSLLDRLAAAGCPAQHISVERPSLEDVFADLTGSCSTDRTKERAA